MKLPFGLDWKSLIVGILFAMYALPFIISLFARRKSTAE